MIRRALSLLLLLLLAAPAWAEVEFSAPTAPVPAYTLVRCELDEGQPGDAWWIVSPDEAVDDFTSEDGRRFYFVAPPGKYTVRALTEENGRKDQGRAVVTILPPGPVPPPPDPTPGPTPGPDPPVPPGPIPVVSGPLWVSYIVEDSTLTPQIAGVGENANFRRGLAGLDATWRAYLDAEEDPARLGLLAPAKAAGLPCAIIQAQDGRIVTIITNPAEDAILAAVKRLRGQQ
jgi:hypothetical protein